MNKEDVISILTENLGMVDYIDVTKYISDLEQENKLLKERIDKATKTIQYIIDYGFDYDGFSSEKDLKGLIDMLVDYAKRSKEILKGRK